MGRHFVGLNGGPAFKVNEALSLQIPVETQDEVERLSDALSAVPDAEMDLVDGLLAHDDDVAGPRRQAMPEMGKSGCAEGR
ncbi:MAG: VOC family protein [Alphaproteobacteria bacterium]